MLGSFIFGLPTDTPATFDATADLAQRAGVSFAQFVMLTPFPGTVDFAKWERESVDGPSIDGIPADPLLAHPVGAAEGVHRIRRWPPMRSGRGRRGSGIGLFAAAIWRRSTCVRSIRSRLAFVLISKLCARQMYLLPGLRPTAPVSRVGPPRPLDRPGRAPALFIAAPMPELQEPATTMANWRTGELAN